LGFWVFGFGCFVWFFSLRGCGASFWVGFLEGVCIFWWGFGAGGRHTLGPTPKPAKNGNSEWIEPAPEGLTAFVRETVEL